MKPFTLITLLLGLLFNSNPIQSQTTVWSENFNNGCAANCLASTYGGWTIIDNDGGINGSAPNNWFVSCAEEGVTPPGCGSSCIGDASLHIGSNPGAGGDMGATYNETSANNATFKLVRSPTISTVGFSSNTLKFDFIAFGSSACSDDRLQLRLSTNNGATWPVGFQFCLNSACCGACNGYSQGQWTTYTLALPAAFNNNPNVRVGFHWRNNGNGSGTDPSGAIDDIRIESSTPLPVTLMDFEAFYENNKAKLHWASTQEVNFHYYDVEKSLDGASFKSIGQVPSKTNSQELFAYYTFFDTKLSTQTVYYRLKMVDLNGNFTYSKVIEFTYDPSNKTQIVVDNIKQKGDMLSFQVSSPINFSANIEIYNIEGKKLVTQNDKDLTLGTNYLTLPISQLTSGLYILKVVNLDVSTKSVSEKFIISK